MGGAISSPKSERRHPPLSDAFLGQGERLALQKRIKELSESDDAGISFEVFMQQCRGWFGPLRERLFHLLARDGFISYQSLVYAFHHILRPYEAPHTVVPEVDQPLNAQAMHSRWSLAQHQHLLFYYAILTMDEKSGLGKITEEELTARPCKRSDCYGLWVSAAMAALFVTKESKRTDPNASIISINEEEMNALKQMVDALFAANGHAGSSSLDDTISFDSLEVWIRDYVPRLLNSLDVVLYETFLVDAETERAAQQAKEEAVTASHESIAAGAESAPPMPVPRHAIYAVGPIDWEENVLVSPFWLWWLGCTLPVSYLRRYLISSTAVDPSLATHASQIVIPTDSLSHVSWKILFDTDQHGFSMSRFEYQCFDYHGPTVLLIHADTDENKKECLLGAYISVRWRSSQHFWGDAECRLFSLKPKVELFTAQVTDIPAGATNVHVEHHFVHWQKDSGIGFGGKLRHHRLSLDPSLQTGKWTSMDDLTYHLPSSTGSSTFQVNRIQVLGLGGQSAIQRWSREKSFSEADAEHRKGVHLLGHKDAQVDKLLLEMLGVHQFSSE